MTTQVPIATIDEVKNMQSQRPDLFDPVTDGFAILSSDDSGNMFLVAGDDVAAALNGLDRTNATIRLHDYAGMQRWLTEQKGVWSTTYPIKTDADSQRKVGQLDTDYRNGFRTTPTNFKLADGTFCIADAAMIHTFYLAIQTHINNCYTVEQDCYNKIMSAAYTTTDQIDTAFGGIPVLPRELWPPSVAGSAGTQSLPQRAPSTMNALIESQ